MTGDLINLVLTDPVETSISRNCKYQLIQVKDDIFEVELSDCFGTKYIYGYLSGEALYIQMENERQKISPSMAGGPQWTIYKRGKNTD